MTTLDPRLEELLSKQEISEQLYRYAQGCDQVDRAKLEACFHPGATTRQGTQDGISAAFIDYAMEVCRALKGCSHMISNIMIAIAGDTAQSEAHFFAHHDRGDAGDRFVKGRYIDTWARRDGVWKITHRVGAYELDRTIERR
jgi:hypothetical protein